MYTLNLHPKRDVKKREYPKSRKVVTFDRLPIRLEVGSHRWAFSLPRVLINLPVLSMLGNMVPARNLLGLDIGFHSIKMVQLRSTDRGVVELVKCDEAFLPHEAIVDGAILDSHVVVEKIRELISVNKIGMAKCAISLSGHSIIVKKICIPEMTQEELDESILWEAEQYIPFNIKDVNADVEIINPKAGQGQMDVVLAAAKKDIVNDYMSVAQAAGLCPVVVDIDAFALSNMFERNYGFPPNETIALVNVGASTININVISKGISVFTRDISLGGDLLTEEIVKQLNISWIEAEQCKKDDEAESSSASREVQKLAERVSGILATEVERSLDFFAATTIYNDMARIYLSGGSVQSSAFIRAMERIMKVPVELINPFKNISVDSRQFDLDLLRKMSPELGVAVGLALRQG